MASFQVFLEGKECTEAALAQAAHGGGPDGMVLGMYLKLLHSLEGQATVVAAVFVDVAIRDRELLAFLQFAQVLLQGVRVLQLLATALLPIRGF